MRSTITGEQRNKDSVSNNSEGYTLIEVLVTIFIMGMILLMVNVVLVALIRTSYDTDARLQTRQGIEFAIEVIRRDVKSANPATIEVPDPETLNLSLSESSKDITFSKEEVGGKGLIKADWGGGDYTNLTSVGDMNITFFNVEMNSDDMSGTVEIIITVRADSTQLKSNGDPVVKNFYKQAIIITKGQEI